MAGLAELPDRTTRRFSFERGGETLSAFVANHDGKLVAYENRCRHLPWPLDWDDGRFYTDDRDYFICHTHGAVYEPKTGFCVMGPCAGQSLAALRVVIEGEDVFVEVEDAAVADSLAVAEPQDV